MSGSTTGGSCASNSPRPRASRISPRSGRLQEHAPGAFLSRNFTPARLQADYAQLMLVGSLAVIIRPPEAHFGQRMRGGSSLPGAVGSHRSAGAFSAAQEARDGARRARCEFDAQPGCRARGLLLCTFLARVCDVIRVGPSGFSLSVRMHSEHHAHVQCNACRGRHVE